MRGLFHKIGMLLLSVMLMAAVLGTVTASASETDDLTGHWAEEVMRKWKDEGLLSGYSDGTVQPDRPVTRGEFITLINRSFQLTEKADVSYTDLPEGYWAEQAAIAVRAGYITGYNDGTIRLQARISREEAAVILYKLLGLQAQDENGLAALEDADDIAAWSQAAINALLAKGMMKGYVDGTFRPKGSLTRAESVTILDKAVTFVAPTDGDQGSGGGTGSGSGDGTGGGSGDGTGGGSGDGGGTGSGSGDGTGGGSGVGTGSGSGDGTGSGSGDGMGSGSGDGTGSGSGDGTGGGSGGGTGSGSGTGSGTPQPGVDGYHLTVTSNQMTIAGGSLLMTPSDLGQLPDQPDISLSVSELLNNTPYLQAEFTIDGVSPAYSGLVDITAKVVSASAGRTADDIQLITDTSLGCSMDQTGPWMDVLKSGIAHSQSVTDLPYLLGCDHRIYAVAKPGTYTIKLQAEDASTHAVVASTEDIVVTALDLSLDRLEFETSTSTKYELQQVSAGGQVVGTGFDPNHQIYQLHIPNAASAPHVWATAASGTITPNFHDMLDSARSEINQYVSGSFAGSYYCPISIGVQSTMSFKVTSGGLSKTYFIKIWRFNDPVPDPLALDETDIQVNADSVAVSGLAAGTTVRVFGSAGGSDLLGTIMAPADAGSNAVTIPVTGLQVKGTVWVEIEGAAGRVAKPYDHTPVPRLNNPAYPAGVQVRMLTPDEVATEQARQNSTLSWGMELSLDSWDYTAPLNSFYYFIIRKVENSHASLVYDDVKPGEKEYLIPEEGTRQYYRYSDTAGGYYQVIFFNGADKAVGFIEISG